MVVDAIPPIPVVGFHVDIYEHVSSPASYAPPGLRGPTMMATATPIASSDRWPRIVNVDFREVPTVQNPMDCW